LINFVCNENSNIFKLKSSFPITLQKLDLTYFSLICSNEMLIHAILSIRIVIEDSIFKPPSEPSPVQCPKYVVILQHIIVALHEI